MGFKSWDVLNGELYALARAGRAHSQAGRSRAGSAHAVGARLVERYVADATGTGVWVSPLGTVPLSLPVAGQLYARGAVDSLGCFLADAVVSAMSRQYPVAVTVAGLGSFGGESAFRGLRHRPLADNARFYGLADWAGVCSVCGCRSADVCHGVPRSMGGNLTRGNLSVGCRDCNRSASSRLGDEALRLLSGWLLYVDVSAGSMAEWVK